MQVPSFNLRKFRAVQGVENWDLIYLTQRRREAEDAESLLAAKNAKAAKG